MKELFTLMFLAAFVRIAAQVPVEVKVESRPSSLGVHPAFEVMVPQATAKEAIDLWRKTIIPNALFKKQPKMQKVKDEWIVNNVLISEITSNPLNVFTQVSTFTGNIFVRIFLQEEGKFLGSPDSTSRTNDAAVRFIRDYAVELYRQAVEKELKTEQKKLKDLENKLSKLQRQNKSFNNKIADAQQNEEDLKNEADQNRELLRDQHKIIQLDSTQTKGKTAQELLEKQVRATEKDLEKTQKSQTKYSRKLNKNERDQRDKAMEIEKQKLRVEDVITKLNNIK